MRGLIGFISSGTVLVILSACGGTSPSSSVDQDPADSPSISETAAEFDLGFWRATWDSDRRAYLDSLDRFGAQLGYLLDNNASAQQTAAVVARMTASIAEAADTWIDAIDAAGTIPAERDDVAVAVDQLRAALTSQSKAYRAVADCGEDVVCQNNRFGGVEAVQGSVGEALNEVPEA